MSLKTFRAFAALLVICAASAVNAQVSLPSNLLFDEGKTSFTVPFELVDNRIFVDVWMEGKGPFKFILDTGGYGGVSREAAARAGLKLGAEVQGRGAGESIVTAREASVGELRIGALRLNNQDLRVFDFSDLRHVFGLKMFDGIIGLPVFSQAVVGVDYARRRLTFAEPSRFKYEGRGTPFPFELERFAPIVRAEVDGLAGTFTVDTGDRSTLTLKGPFVERHGLGARYAPAVEGVTGWGIGGPIRARVVRAKYFRLGGFEIKSPVTRFSLQRAGAFAAADVAGNIGAGILRRFTVTFDYARRRMYLERNGDFDAPDTFDRAGLWLSQSVDGKTFEVFDVVAGGPAADAGLKAGDHVLAVDGRPASSLSLIETRTSLKSPSKRRVKLTLQTGGARREVVVHLRDLV